MVKKSVALLCLFFMLICSFAACSTIKYNAVFYNDAELWINEDFIAENRTAYASYGPDYGLQTDGSLPKFRTFIINDSTEMNDIFNERFDLTVDFGKDMLVIYTFTTSENLREANLKNVELQDGCLNISYKTPVKFGIVDASIPMQHWFLVKLDKLEISSVSFFDVT